MVNATIQQLVLILMPIIGDQPPSVFLSPSFAAAVSDDGDMNQYLVQFLQSSTKLRARQRPERPHPEIGGTCITLDWLQAQTDRDCLWTFR
jgi:hypothetical protein